MTETVSAADANRHFSKILRQVQAGHRYVVTSHGRPVAQIVPMSADIAAGSSEQALSLGKEALLKRLRNQPIRNIGPWTRDELYED